MALSNAYGDFSRYYDYLGWNKFAAVAARRVQTFIRFQNRKPETILDLACGTGELERIMSRSGISFTGVDASPGMLKVAQGKCPGTRFVNNDAAEVSLKRKFDMVLLLFDSANHMRSKTHLRAVIRNARRHLKDGGFFIFDFLTEPGLERWEHIDIRRTSDYTVITNGYYYPEKLLADIFIEAFVKQGKTYDRVYQRIVERTFPPADVISMLQKAGFEKIIVSPFDQYEEIEEASRLWFVCG